MYNWEDTRIHSMSGLILDQKIGTTRYQSREETISARNAYVDKMMNKAADAYKKTNYTEFYKSLGLALHSVQDQFAWGQGFQEWHPDPYLIGNWEHSHGWGSELMGDDAKDITRIALEQFK